jgi:SAM-dependent methyltransferase
MEGGNAMTVQPDYFEALFRANDDPWKFRSRWYEERKRALTLACLPARRYEMAYEPGCANGELSAALAERCDRLVASDGAAAAVEIARGRLATLAHVEVRQMWIPDEWPQQSFDLIVVSELAYYLDGAAIETLVHRIRGSLRPGGTVLACHWRRRIEGCLFDGNEVHRLMNQHLQLHMLSDVVEPDLRLQVWCTDAQSVAHREGLG